MADWGTCKMCSQTIEEFSGGVSGGGDDLCDACYEVDRRIDNFVTSRAGLERVLAALGKARAEVDNASLRLQSAALLYIADRLADSKRDSCSAAFEHTSNPFACSYGFMLGRAEDVEALARAVAMHAGAPLRAGAREALFAAIDELTVAPRVRAEAIGG